MKSKFSLIELIIAIAMIAVISLITLPTQFLHAQVDAFNVATLTTSTNTVATNTTATVTTPAIYVRGSEGVGFVAKFKLGAADTNNVVFRFDASADGTTWTTTKPFSSGNIAANGTNSVVHFWNFGPTDSTELRNVQFLRLADVQNANTASNAALTIESLSSTIYNR